ncbi:transposase [Undibacterium curvum]|uniref:transposase n=1 Tax=Undibacterium curvum TaxID=2762294 RepID=UPI003D097559
MRQLVKRSNWLLLRTHENVPEDYQTKPNQFLVANQTLITAYVVNASLKDIWQVTPHAMAQSLTNMGAHGP